MKKFLSAILCTAIIISGQVIIPTGAETRKASEIAADIVLNNISKFRNVLEKDANSTVAKGLGFIDIDFDGQLELWVHSTKRSEESEASNCIYELEGGELIELLNVKNAVPSGGLDDVVFSTNPYGTLDLYRDSAWNVFYLADSSTGSVSTYSLTWYSMITFNGYNVNESPRFLRVDGKKGGESDYKHTVYSYYGEIENEYKFSEADKFDNKMNEIISEWENLNLNVKFSTQQNDFFGMSEKQKRDFLIESFEAFDYTGFTRNDDNLGDTADEDSDESSAPIASRPVSPHTDNDKIPPRPKSESSDTDSDSDKDKDSDSDTELPKTDGTYEWNTDMYYSGAEITVLSCYQPSVKSSDGSWDIYSVGSMVPGRYLAGKWVDSNGVYKYGLVGYKSSDFTDAVYDEIAAGYGGVLVGIDSWGKTVIVDEEGNKTERAYDGELGGGIEGEYYWITKENKLYVTDKDGIGAESDDTRPMIVPMGVLNSDKTIEPAQPKDDMNAYNMVFIKNGKLVANTANEMKFIADAGKFCDGIIPVKNSSGKWGYCDEKGKVVIPFEYDAAWDGFPEDGYGLGSRAYDSSAGYVVLKKNDRYALYTSAGEKVIDFGEFDEILPVYSVDGKKCAWVRSAGTWRGITLTGKLSDDDSDTSDDKNDTDESPKHTIPDKDHKKETGDVAFGSGSKESEPVIKYVLAVLAAIVVVSGMSLGFLVLFGKKK